MDARDDTGRESSATRLLRELERLLGDTAGLQQWQAGSGLETSHYAILDVLQREGPLTTTDVAGALYLDTSTVSRQVQAAERRGLVDRVDSTTDRRASLLSITVHGAELLGRAATARNALVEEALRGWSDGERAALLRQVERLAAACRDRWRPTR